MHDVRSPPEPGPDQDDEETQIVTEKAYHAATDGRQVADGHRRRLGQRAAILGEERDIVAQGQQVFSLFHQVNGATAELSQVITGDHVDAHGSKMATIAVWRHDDAIVAGGDNEQIHRS